MFLKLKIMNTRFFQVRNSRKAMLGKTIIGNVWMMSLSMPSISQMQSLGLWVIFLVLNTKLLKNYGIVVVATIAVAVIDGLSWVCL